MRRGSRAGTCVGGGAGGVSSGAPASTWTSTLSVPSASSTKDVLINLIQESIVNVFIPSEIAISSILSTQQMPVFSFDMYEAKKNMLCL